MSVEPLVAVESRAQAAVASAAWRHRGNIRATVVVKAEFSFADGKLTQVDPEPVRPDTEMAFVLAHAEVLFAGLALPNPPASPTRIAVWRGSDELLGIDIDAPSSLGSTIGGPISPFSPERSAHLHGFSPAALQHAFVELPDTFDTTFFQCAPPRQRLAAIAGGDTIVLDNLFPGHRRFTLRIPTAQVSATGRMDDRSAPIRLRMDTVFIDAHAHRCTLLWRGRLAASNPDAFARATAWVELAVTDLGGVEGDTPPPWQRVQPTAGPSTAPFQSTTVELGATMIKQAVATTPTPFAAAPRAERPAQPRVAIPGAPWSAAPAPAVNVPSPEGIAETMGLAELAESGQPLPGGIRLPKGLKRPKAAKKNAQTSPPAAVPPAAVSPPAVVPPAAVPAPVAVPPPAATPADDVAEQQRAREAEENEKLQAARKQEEQAAAAEERRREEAERFAAEQRAAEKAMADREAKEAEERKETRKKIKTFMYGKFKKK